MSLFFMNPFYECLFFFYECLFFFFFMNVSSTSDNPTSSLEPQTAELDSAVLHFFYSGISRAMWQNEKPTFISFSLFFLPEELL